MKTAKITSILFCMLIALLPAAGCVGAGGNGAPKDVPLDNIMDNIKAAYGEDYIPSGEVPEALLQDVYGLTPDMYTDIRAEMSMMSTFPDTVIVVKAAEGRIGDVQEALNAAWDRAVSDTLQYPMNIPKVNAATVVSAGNYAAFLMVGAIGSFEDVESKEALEFARAETQKAVDAFNGSFE